MYLQAGANRKESEKDNTGMKPSKSAPSSKTWLCTRNCMLASVHIYSVPDVLTWEPQGVQGSHLPPNP